MSTMRAVVLREKGGPEVLTVEDVPTPVPGPEEDRLKSSPTRTDKPIAP